MKILSLIIALLNVSTLNAQNLVPNASFEIRTSCPYTIGKLKGFCSDWYSYTHGTPDYFDTCAFGFGSFVPNNDWGYQKAIGGGSYSGFGTFTITLPAPGVPAAAKEYIANTIQPMVSGKFYEVSVSVSLANKSNFGSDGIGVLLYQNYFDSITTSYDIPRVPQVSYNRYGIIIDTTKWLRLKGYFLADSTYNHIVIGQFKDISNLQYKKYYQSSTPYAYYYIDSVVVRETANLNIEVSDSLFCAGDTIQVGCFVNPVYFNSSNTFNVQLSDKNGSFSSPTIIGSLLGYLTDSISAIIPLGLPQGNSYRMRLTASNPSLISPDNGFDIQIGVSKPIISTSSNVPLCASDTLTITANTITSSVEWYWWRPYVYPTITLSNTFSKKISYADSGLYIVAASNGGCMSKPDTVNLQVLNLEYPSVSISVKPGYHEPIGAQLTFIANPFAGGATPQYQWYKNGNIIVNATDSFYKAVLGFSFSEGDSFCVELTSSYKCPIVKTVQACLSHYKYITGIESLESQSSITVYPNPVHDNMYLHNVKQAFRYVLYDVMGKKILEGIYSVTTKDIVSIDLTRLQHGIYILSIVNEDGSKSVNKILKD